MKVGLFAVLPSEVRYDSHLRDKSKLLYAEIAAATNAYGVCEDDNRYFASAMRVETRTITSLIEELISNGHLVRLQEKGRRKLKVVLKGIPLPDNPELKVVEEGKLNAVREFTNKLTSMWSHRLWPVQEPEQFVPMVGDAMKLFSQEEILRAMENRIAFLRQSPYHNGEDVREYELDFKQFITNEQLILSWVKSK